MAGDASWASVVLLLAGKGANGSNTFTDTSPTPKTATLIGTPTISTAHFEYGSSSMLFNGTTDALSFAHTADLNLATGDFTIEAFVYVTSLATNRTILQKDQSFGTTFPSYLFNITSTGQVSALVGTGNSAGYSQTLSSAAGIVTTNTMMHLAYTRSGTTLRLFANGTLAQTATQTGTAVDGGKPLLIGRYPAGGGASDTWFSGHMHLRVTKGLARYTATFTPPTRFEDGLGEVAGIVRDSSGAVAARTVRAYRRDTGALIGNIVSDAGTGAYSFFTPTLDELTVLALDDQTSGTYYDDEAIRVIPA